MGSVFPEFQESLTEEAVTSDITRLVGGFGKAAAKSKMSQIRNH